MSLPLALGLYLNRRLRIDDLIRVMIASRDCARRQKNRKGEAAALAGLGVALSQRKRSDEAISALQDAVAICRQVGDRRGEGTALENLESARAAVAELLAGQDHQV